MNFVEFKFERTAITPLIKTERTFGPGNRVRLSGRDYAIVVDDLPRVAQTVAMGERGVSGTVRVIRVRPAGEQRYVSVPVVFEWPCPPGASETRNGKPRADEGPGRAGRAAVCG